MISLNCVHFFRISFSGLFIIFFFFFNDTATTEIYTLSLHDALPIFKLRRSVRRPWFRRPWFRHRSEEHTSELQSRQYLVCRLLLEKKKKTTRTNMTSKTKNEMTQCDRKSDTY